MQEGNVLNRLNEILRISKSTVGTSNLLGLIEQAATSAIKELTEIISKRAEEKSKKAEQDKHTNDIHNNLSILRDVLTDTEKQCNTLLDFCKIALIYANTGEVLSPNTAKELVKAIKEAEDKIPIKKQKPRIIIVVQGGLVSGVCSNLDEADISVLDHDTKQGGSAEELDMIKILSEECVTLNAIY